LTPIKTLGKPIPRKVIAAIFIIVVLVVAGAAGAFILMSGGKKKKKEENVPSEPENLVPMVEIFSETGYTNENDYSQISLYFDEDKLLWVNCSLYWSDESSSYIRGNNEPDEFCLALYGPNGEMMTQCPMDTSGWIELSFMVDYESTIYDEDFRGDWVIVVSAGDCGDDYSRFGLRTSSDNGNDWWCDCEITCLIAVEDVENVEETEG